MTTIFQLLKNMISLEAPIHAISAILVSVKPRKERYRTTHRKTFIDRLQTAKRKKEEFRIKSVDFSRAHQRAYIVVNLRKNYNQKVEIGKSPSCGCGEFWKRIL